MADTDAPSLYRSSTIDAVTSNQSEPVQLTSGGGTIAVARDNARQHVGNVIHNYFGSSQQDGLQRTWLKVIEWLVPSKAATDLQTLIYTESHKKHDPGTGVWFSHGDPINRWLSGEDPLRWLCGSVGCGKTVLFSTAIEQTRKKCRCNRGTRFAYFYCSSRDVSGQDLDVLLRMLLVQLSPPSEIPQPLQALFNLCNDVYPPKIPTFPELKACVRDLVKLYAEHKDVYILIDALDEIPLESRDDVFDILDAIGDQDLPYLHLLVTSRDHADIREALTKPLSWNEVVVEKHLVQADVERYVSNTIERNRKLRSLGSDLKQEILHRVAVKGNGMFLWASLSIKALQSIQVPTSDRVRQCLKDLPPDLPKTYLKILSGIDSYFVPYASRALAWLVFSSRPLYVEELAEACSFDMTEAALLTERLKPANIYELLSDLITIQPPLSPEKRIQRPKHHTAILAHASVGEFLLQKFSSTAPDFPEQANIFLLDRQKANALIAQSCLAYLFRYNSYEERRADYALRSYAWYNWDKHIPTADDGVCPVRDSSIIRHRAVELYKDLEFLTSEERGLWPMNPDTVKRIDAMKAATAWLPDQASQPRLMEALDVPFFHQNFDAIYESGYPTSDMISNQRNLQPLSSELVNPIRLLEILPCLDEASIVRGALINTTLGTAPRYVALSCMWHSSPGPMDSPRPEPDIIVDGLPSFSLGKLSSILRLLRSRVEENQSPIWVDAFCEIFANSRDVVVGLNDINDSAEQGIEYLRKVSAVINLHGTGTPAAKQDISDIIALVEENNAWDAILDLFSDTWWQWIWVVQDVVFASNAMFLIGSASVSIKVVEDFMRAEAIIRDILSERKSPHLSRFVDHSGWRAAKNILQTRLEYSEGRAPSLPVLVRRFHNHQSASMEDRVHALMAISNPQSNPGSNSGENERSAAEAYDNFLRL